MTGVAVTFSDEVQLLADGTRTPVTVAGDNLDNYSTLVCGYLFVTFEVNIRIRSLLEKHTK